MKEDNTEEVLVKVKDFRIDTEERERRRKMGRKKRGLESGEYKRWRYTERELSEKYEIKGI